MILHPRRLGVALGCVIFASACASTSEQPYVEPTNQNVLGSLEAAYDGRGQQIYVTNMSSVPIVVTSVHLTECKNIKNRCEVRRMNVPVGPRQRRAVEMVEYTRSGVGGSSFRYSFSWERERQAPSTRL